MSGHLTLRDALREGLATVPVPVGGAWVGLGRDAAYTQAHRYIDTGGREGLPALPLGRKVVCPVALIARMVGLDPPGHGDGPPVTTPEGPSEVSPLAAEPNRSTSAG